MAARTERVAGSVAYRADLDGVRALAIGLVVAYHAGVPWLGGGYVGVDVFFVLSGFLITSLLVDELERTNGLRFARFYARRARRLLPMSALVLVVVTLLFRFSSAPINYASLHRDVTAAALYFSNWHFAAGSVAYQATTDRSPVLHFWSLSVEEQFYVVWPALLFVAHRLRRLAWVVVLATAASFVASVLLSSGAASQAAYFGLHTRAWELGTGALLALSGTQLARLPERFLTWFGTAGLVAVVVSAHLLAGSHAFPGWLAAAPVFGTAAIVAAGTAQSGFVRVWLSARPVTYVGRVSYGWYLWHWPTLIFVNDCVSGIGNARSSIGGVPARGWWAALALAVSFGLSVVSHHVLENPVRTSRWLAELPRRSLRLAAALTATAVLTPALGLTAASAAVPTTIRAVVGWRQPGGAGSGARAVTLRMTPAQARADLPRATRDCYAGFTVTIAAADCQLGDPDGVRTIVLVGDSHAQQFVPAFVRAASARHWRLFVWAKPACPFIDLAVRLPQFDGRYPWCDAWRASVLSRLQSLGPVDAVVSAHFSAAFEDRTRYRTRDGERVDGDDVAAQWRSAWATTRAQLAAVARHVVVVRDTPYARVDVPSCLSAHRRDATPCSPARADALADAELLSAAEAAVPGTDLLDPDGVLCPELRCPVVWADGTVVYRDDRHLTATMAARLAGVLGRQLAAILRRS